MSATQDIITNTNLVIYQRFYQQPTDLVIFKLIHKCKIVQLIIQTNCIWSTQEFNKLLHFLLHPRFMNFTLIKLNSTHILDILSNVMINIWDCKFDHIINQYLIYYKKIWFEHVPWSLTTELNSSICFKSIPIWVFETLFLSNNDDLPTLINFIKLDKIRYNRVSQLCQVLRNIIQTKFKQKNLQFGFQDCLDDLQWYSFSQNKCKYRILKKYVLSLLK